MAFDSLLLSFVFTPIPWYVQYSLQFLSINGQRQFLSQVPPLIVENLLVVQSMFSEMVHFLLIYQAYIIKCFFREHTLLLLLSIHCECHGQTIFDLERINQELNIIQIKGFWEII